MKESQNNKANLNNPRSVNLKPDQLVNSDCYPYLLVLFLIIDVFFVFASWLYANHFITNDNFDIARDRGYGEIFQYAKEFAIAIILFRVFRKTKDKIFIVWSLFFAYLLLDDSFKIHERIGGAIASNLISKGPHIFNLRSQDFGELAISVVVGIMFFLLFIRYFYNSRQVFRKVSFNLIALVILLLFCGIFVDMAHISLPDVASMNTLEDGGEMIAMTLIFWCVFNLFKHSAETSISIINDSTINRANFVFDYLNNLFTYLHLTPSKSTKKLQQAH